MRSLRWKAPSNSEYWIAALWGGSYFCIPFFCHVHACCIQTLLRHPLVFSTPWTAFNSALWTRLLQAFGKLFAWMFAPASDMMNDSGVCVHDSERRQNARWARGALIQAARCDVISWLIQFIVDFNINVKLILYYINGRAYGGLKWLRQLGLLHE